MKNPYLYGYLPLITIVLLSLTFGMNAVTATLNLIESMGVYAGIREFLSDMELRIFLLIFFALIFFMLFSALKLIGETIYELAMLFFSKDQAGETIHSARGGYVIFFFGALATAMGIQSFTVLIGIFILTVFIYFIFTIYKMSQHMSTLGMVGMMFFIISTWTLFVTTILYVMIKLYNGLLSSLPFT